MSNSSQKSNGHSPLRDLAGFLLLAVAVFLLLAVATYNPLDPSLNTVVAGPRFVRNLCGIAGSYSADILMQLFGYASYALPILLLAVVWAVVFKPSALRASQRFFGVLLFLCSVTLFCALAAGDQPRLPAWGGVLGYLQKLFFVRYAGRTGAVLFALAVFAGSLVLAIGLTFGGFMAWVRKLWGVVLGLASWLKPVWAKTMDSAGMRLEKEEREIERGMDEIRSSSPPAIPLLEKLESRSDYPKIGGEPAHPIPIVLGKVKKTQEMPKFHSVDEVSDEEKKSREKRTYKLPDITLLEAPPMQSLQINRDELFANAQILEHKLKDFGVFGKVVEVQPGPVVTMYEFEPAPGVKVNQITRLNDDLALALKAMSVRITLIPGKAVIGIEVANRERQVVYLKDILANDIFAQSPSRLTIALGKDISGIPFVSDLRKMPHLLMAGATGSGKSVSVNSAILSVLYKATPDEVRMILVDPKMLELSFYEDIPHLLLPVVTDPRKAATALRWAVREMERRYRLMADIGVRNIEGYNKKVYKVMEERESGDEGKKPKGAETELLLDAAEETQTVQPEEHKGNLPYVMIVIDELADLMMVSSHEVEESIIRLAQMARAAGIHLLLATQRPSVDVITGVIKANMPARVSFQVSSQIDSRTILDMKGAELLLGAGDMLFIPPGTSKLHRIHGAFVTDNEVKRVTDFWKAQGNPDFDHEILKAQEEQLLAAEGNGEDDEMYAQALNLVRAHRVASISMIQRKLRIGYNRAARIVERMEEEGLLAPGEVGKPREVIMSRFEG
ncbi:MAG: DNA translocase FtsK 4TM domain-containing protein [Pseudomonadota bacterium]